MAHCPFEKLLDVTSVLESIRSLTAIKENKPGIFYIGSQSFLHFHVKEDRRWADAREGSSWGKTIEIPFHPTLLQKKEFLNEIIRRHSAVLKVKKLSRQ